MATIAEMREENEPIAININNTSVNYIFYSDSELLKQLKIYPYFQIVIIALFLSFPAVSQCNVGQLQERAMFCYKRHSVQQSVLYMESLLIFNA